MARIVFCLVSCLTPGPYCQVSSGDSCLPPGGLRLPPAYVNPPVYDSLEKTEPFTASGGGTETVPHYLGPHDSVSSLALQYGIAAEELRRLNQLHTDGQLWAHKVILIPSRSCPTGTSRSPHPIDTPKDEARKLCIRRFMLACRVSEYDEAVLYLEHSCDNLELAIQRYQADERWEREYGRFRQLKPTFHRICGVKPKLLGNLRS